MFVTFKSFRSKLIPNFPPFWACKLMDSSYDAPCFQEMNESFEDIIIILLVAYHHRMNFFSATMGIFFVGSRPLYYNTSLQNVYTQGWWTSSSFYIASASMSVSSSTLSLKNRWESSGTHMTLSLRIIYFSFHSFLNILISSDSDYVPESESVSDSSVDETLVTCACGKRLKRRLTLGSKYHLEHLGKDKWWEGMMASRKMKQTCTSVFALAVTWDSRPSDLISIFLWGPCTCNVNWTYHVVAKSHQIDKRQGWN